MSYSIPKDFIFNFLSLFNHFSKTEYRLRIGGDTLKKSVSWISSFHSFTANSCFLVCFKSMSLFQIFFFFFNMIFFCSLFYFTFRFKYLMNNICNIIINLYKYFLLLQNEIFMKSEQFPKSFFEFPKFRSNHISL